MCANRSSVSLTFVSSCPGETNEGFEKRELNESEPIMCRWHALCGKLRLVDIRFIILLLLQNFPESR